MEAKANLLLLLLLLFPLLLTPTSGRGTTSFIRTSCSTTRYPKLCEKSLSSYAATLRPSSQRLLAETALSVSLQHAQSAYTFVNHLSSGAISTLGSHENGIMQDCIGDMSDSVSHLRQSISQMSRMGRYGSPAYAYRVSNVQTWASAALTDVTTCLYSFEESGVKEEVKAAIRKKSLRVAKMTAIALDLVNRIAPVND